MLRPSNQWLETATGHPVNLPIMTARPLLESKQVLNGEIVAAPEIAAESPASDPAKLRHAALHKNC